MMKKINTDKRNTFLEDLKDFWHFASVPLTVFSLVFYVYILAPLLIEGFISEYGFLLFFMLGVVVSSIILWKEMN